MLMAIRRRLRFLLIGVACLALLTVGTAWLLLHGPGSAITKANFDRIENGMTLAQVEELFGKQGAAFHGYAEHDLLKFPDRDYVRKPYLWENVDRSYAIVVFDENRRVVEKARWEDSPDKLGDKIRRLLHWPR
jgi:hypothetical protein